MKKKLLIGVGVVIVLFMLGIALAVRSQAEFNQAETARVQAEKKLQADKAHLEADRPTPEKLLAAVNAERAKAGVAPLRVDPLLNKSAQYKAQDMVDRNYFNHKDPVTGKNNGLDYARSIGAPCRVWISENITDNTVDRDNTTWQAMYSWMHSPSHKAAILDPRYESTGFGIAKTKVVQHFCDEH